jgi:two-component system, chemotaxis family, chemotaxis protein CheY
VKRVLIVDDSETIRTKTATALSRAGFEVLEAADGIQGLACATDNDVDVVLLDVNMPGLGGIEVLEQLLSNPRTAKIPVLMLTTEANLSLIERAKSLGARGWMVKPIKSDQLVKAVTTLAN